MGDSRWWTGSVLVVAIAAGSVGCGGDTSSTDNKTPATTSSSASESTQPYSNGLSAEQRSRFYHVPEGGEIYPVDWLLALEATVTEGGRTETRPFLQTVERFGFLPDGASGDNPYGLPVGMTVARSVVTGLDTVGLNCAACHVGELTYAGSKMRIDGGPNLISVPAFIKALVAETTETAKSPARLLRFVKGARAARAKQLADRAAAPDGGEPTPGDLKQAITAIAARIATLKTVPALKAADTGTPEGFGRTDAFGNARNELFSRDAVPPTAPVSLPHLWGMEQTAWLQWGANTNSVLQRNIGQIIGTGAWTRGNMSSVKLENLGVMEELAYAIQPPKWPAAFPKVDDDKAAKGRELYRQMCVSCHETWVTTPTGLRQYQLYSLEEAGTDPATAVNFEKPVRTASGTQGFPEAAFAIIDGVKQGYYQKNKLSDDTIARLERRSLRPPPPAPMFRSPLRDSEKYPDTKGGKVYPAKTLAGIWATAPYLHNGSVPTLYDLLLPVAQRPKRFAVGQREYDPVKIGYQQDPAKYQLPPSLTPTFLDTSLPGNSNAGHDWNFDRLTDDQRWAIVEYLKTF